MAETADPDRAADDAGETSADYARGLARAFAGALLFSFPLLMTMEMWQLGFSMDPLRLALFVGLSLPMLFGLASYSGFERTLYWRDDLFDALAAFAVGCVTSGVLLAVFGVLAPTDSLRVMAGKVAVAAVPAAIGAVVASRQLGQSGAEDEDSPDRRDVGYAGQLFLMAVGAVFVAFNVAPTEEMILIGYKMSPWQALGLAALSLLVLHALVYSVGLPGQEEQSAGRGPWLTFAHFTVAGYGLALLVSLGMLWLFGRTAGESLAGLTQMTVTLAFPAALGAATARLVL